MSSCPDQNVNSVFGMEEGLDWIRFTGFQEWESRAERGVDRLMNSMMTSDHRPLLEGLLSVLKALSIEVKRVTEFEFRFDEACCCCCSWNRLRCFLTSSLEPSLLSKRVFWDQVWSWSSSSHTHSPPQSMAVHLSTTHTHTSINPLPSNFTSSIRWDGEMSNISTHPALLPWLNSRSHSLRSRPKWW